MGVRSLNKVMLIGNMTRDPELKYTGSGTPVCSFSIATNRSWTDDSGENKEATEFHNLVAWGKLAELVHQLLAKGMKVWVEGALRTRSWNDDDGVTHYKTEVRVDNFILLDSRGKHGVGFSDDGSDNGSVSDGDGSVSSGKSPEELLDELNDAKKGGKSKSKGKKKDKEDKKSKEEDDPLDDLPF